MLKSKEFRRFIMPIVIINSIFCTGLLEYYTDRSTQVIGFVYVSVAATCYCALFYMLEYAMSGFWANQTTDIRLLTIHFQFCHNIIVYLASIFGGIIRRKKVRLSMRQLENCTRAMDQLGIPEDYSGLSTYKYFVIICFATILISGITCQLMHASSGDANYFGIILYLLIENIPPVISFTVNFSFIHWIRYTEKKLGQLNTVLRSMLTTTIESPQHRRVLRARDKWKDISTSSDVSPNSKMDENIRKLKRIKHIHLELIKFARNTNEAYGLHILMSMTTCFLLITTLSYNLYVTTISAKSIPNLLDILINIYWISFLGLEVFCVNHVCAMTAMELHDPMIFPHAAETGDILCEMYEPSMCEEFRDVVRQFTYQIVQNPLTFTACGFFDLDHTYINAVIGSITTYLVILIQVGHGSKKGSRHFINNSTSTI